MFSILLDHIIRYFQACHMDKYQKAKITNIQLHEYEQWTHSNVFSDLLYFQKHTVASSAVDIRYRASPLARGQNYKQKKPIRTL